MKNTFTNLGYTLGGGNPYRKYGTPSPNFTYMPASNDPPNTTQSNPMQQVQFPSPSGGSINFSNLASPTGMQPPALTHGANWFPNPPNENSQQYYPMQPITIQSNPPQHSQGYAQSNPHPQQQQQQPQTMPNVFPETFFQNQQPQMSLGCHVNVGNRGDQPIVYVNNKQIDGTDPGESKQYQPSSSPNNRQGGDGPPAELSNNVPLQQAPPPQNQQTCSEGSDPVKEHRVKSKYTPCGQCPACQFANSGRGPQTPSHLAPKHPHLVRQPPRR